MTTDAALDTHVQDQVTQICRDSRVAARVLATATRATKDAALRAMADELSAAAEEIIAANAEDLRRGEENGLTTGLLDRLRLDEARIQSIADALRELAALPDPVGEVVRGSTLPNGLRLRQVRVPMGVVGMIYEARPNVTVDAAGLALKSGNAVILRGGSAAADSNRAIIAVLRRALEGRGLPADLIQSVDEFGRAGGVALMRARGLVDVLVPRGGAGLISTVVRESVVPVIETGVGNCHVYVDASADVDKALPAIINSKVHRPSVCNATETILVHADAAEMFVPAIVSALAAVNVKIHADVRVAELAPQNADIVTATDEDWATEYLDNEVAMAVVPNMDAALEHIRTWSSGHTDAIFTSSVESSERFQAEVDSAAVMVNASTRFTDGGEFGLGAEIGISTQKLHARGPMGLAELTTTKWLIVGDNHVRE
ncbi:MAG TPA: glutamate-5-semialdehyde dehydrogenase [Actinomycetales bacterium]|nr:glutamate-5-semialdehyde dehydrogenase [Actinomycetales bacterium]